MDLLRRTLLKGVASAGVMAGLVSAGLLRPTLAYASEWNKAAFEAKDLDQALKALTAEGATANPGLSLKAPEIAENGAVVPIDVASTIPNTRSISILVKKNPLPLAAHFDFEAAADPSVSVRLKMAETSEVIVIAKADGKSFVAKKEVKVTAGGCGG